MLTRLIIFICLPFIHFSTTQAQSLAIARNPTNRGYNFKDPEPGKKRLEATEGKFKSKGYFIIAEGQFSPSIGTVEYGINSYKPNETIFGFNLINGYQFNEYFTSGVGLGFERLRNHSFIPLTFDMRAFFGKGRISPMLNLKMGYAFGLYDYPGSSEFNPSIGFRAYVSHRTALLVSVGFKMRSRQISYLTSSSSYSPFSGWSNQYSTHYEDVQFKYLTMNAGLLF